jgi:glycine betaine/choline ABC-type transport system substrate-binding protein
MIAAFSLLLCSCAPSHSDRIVIGSKNFTESLMLGELLAQLVESRTHLKVERRFYLAGTYICQQAMLAGRIDLYPEYTGTALTAILKKKVLSGDNDKAERHSRNRRGTHRSGTPDLATNSPSVRMATLAWRPPTVCTLPRLRA